MKKSLIMLSIMGLSATHVNASTDVVTTDSEKTITLSEAEVTAQALAAVPVSFAAPTLAPAPVSFAASNVDLDQAVETQITHSTTVSHVAAQAATKTSAADSVVEKTKLAEKTDKNILKVVNDGTITKVTTNVNVSTTPLIDRKVVANTKRYATVENQTDQQLIESIELLSAKASRKEDELAKLAEKSMQKKAKEVAAFTSFGTTANVPKKKVKIKTIEKAKKKLVAKSKYTKATKIKSKKVSKRRVAKPVRKAATKVRARRLSRSAPPARAAARASRTARSRTTGLCARYVRKALQSAGYRFTPNPSAYQYATRGTLAKAGFVKISNRSRPQVGDVVVYNRSAKHRHGHIQIWDGRNWVSDFRQRSKSPYRGRHSYTTWRDARYLNRGSKGTYLALK